MEVNTQIANGYYSAYRSTKRVDVKEMSAFTLKTDCDSSAFDQTISETKSLGIGFLFVGDHGYGMSAEQRLNGDSDDILVRVKITKGENNFETYDVNLSEVDTGSATVIEMFALCQYADANGTGVNSTWGSFHALKTFSTPFGERLEYSSLEEAVSEKRNWGKALSESKLTLEKQSTGETLSAADVFKMLKDTMLEAHKLTKENIKKEDDFRKMSEDQWDKLIAYVDKYIDDRKKELERLKELQEEAIMKGAASAPADTKTIAASKAALIAAANGIVGEAPEPEASPVEKVSWTYDLQTEDQTVLATAKMANEFAPDVLSKAQELALTGDTTTGISETENAKECATLDESDEKKKTWTITAFTEQGIICSECTDGVTRELWRLEYKNPEDCQKVWDYLGQFDKDDDLKFAGSKSLWEAFLSGEIQ